MGVANQITNNYVIYLIFMFIWNAFFSYKKNTLTYKKKANWKEEEKKSPIISTLEKTTVNVWGLYPSPVLCSAHICHKSKYKIICTVFLPLFLIINVTYMPPYREFWKYQNY